MKFDFNEAKAQTQVPSKWICNDIIPAGQLVVILAQSGVGKSLLVEYLAICIVCGIDFCGHAVQESDVLIIDQDTPTDRLNAREAKFLIGSHGQPKHDLYIESMQGHYLKKDIIDVIKGHPTCKTIIIDSLISVCGSLNINMNSDLSPILTRIKQSCLTEDRTIIINHHISEKKEVSIDLLMQADSHQFAMAASAIIQQADTYYLVGATAEGGSANRIYLRPVAKRLQISTKPLIIAINPVGDLGERMDLYGTYEPELDEVQADVMGLFRENSTLEEKYHAGVEEIYKIMAHRHSEANIRKALTDLQQTGLLILTRHGHNLFKYHLL